VISPQDHERLQAYLAGEMSPNDLSALESQLKNDPELADALLWAAREETIYADWARMASQSESIVPTISAEPTRHLATTARRVWIAAAALTTAAAIALVVRESFFTRQVAARLEQVAGHVIVVGKGERRAAAAGESMLVGQGLEMVGDDAWAVVAYPDGTRLEFDGDTIVVELSGGNGTSKRVFLADGNVRADVAKQPPGQPMILKTANAEVVVLGTKFDLSGNQTATYVGTSEGAVRLVRGDGRSVEVPAGFESVADGNLELNVQPSPPRFRRSRFATPGNHRTTLLSPDGQTLITSQFRSGTVTLWNVSDHREQATLDADARQVSATAVSRDGTKLATAGSERRIIVWDLATGAKLQTLDAPERLQALHFSNDGATLLGLALLSQNRLELHAWDWAAQQRRSEPQALWGEAWSFSHSGRLLAVASARNKNVAVWDLTTLRERVLLPKRTARTTCLAMSPDDARIAVSDNTGLVAVYDVESGREERTFFPPGGAAQGLAFSPDGTQLAMGLRFATVRMWSLLTGKQLFVLEGDRRPGATASVRSMFFTPDLKSLVTTESQDDSIVRLWDLPAN
jgi:WD40 repeat protein